MDGEAGGWPRDGSADPDGDVTVSRRNAERAAMEMARRSAETMYAADQATRMLGISIDEVGPGRAVARMTVDERMVNGHGIAHGGYIFLLADSAFAFACNSYGEVTVAAYGGVSFVTPAHLGERLEATAEERIRYGRNGIYDVLVRCVGDGRTVAEYRGHSRCLGRALVPPGAAGATGTTAGATTTSTTGGTGSDGRAEPSGADRPAGPAPLGPAGGRDEEEA